MYICIRIYIDTGRVGWYMVGQWLVGLGLVEASFRVVIRKVLSCRPDRVVMECLAGT